jgi:hypothetical protein
MQTRKLRSLHSRTRLHVSMVARKRSYSLEKSWMKSQSALILESDHLLELRKDSGQVSRVHFQEDFDRRISMARSSRVQDIKTRSSSVKCRRGCDQGNFSRRMFIAQCPGAQIIKARSSSMKCRRVPYQDNVHRRVSIAQ